MVKSKDRKKHWEEVFLTKDTSKVSWYQPVPETSLKIIENLNLLKTANIIEVGSGDSYLVDFLLNSGYSSITLLDISEEALNTVKNRLREKAANITFISDDILNLNTTEKYDVWHDRAVFHFMTQNADIEKYIQIVTEKLKSNGILILATFSNNGPDTCSGLKVQQYSELKLEKLFEKDFKKIDCFTQNHLTPLGSIQNFLFCVFRKK